MTPPFAAVLLAGGQSRRMGQDKALLPLPDGRQLWERQRDVLLALEPAEWFVSGSWREGFPGGLPWIADDIPGQGPLAGITAALKAMRSPRLVVLAVDLPAMTADYLRGLLEADAHGGVVPQRADGFYEPLAAVYSRQAARLADERLHAKMLALQTFVHALRETGLAVARTVTEKETMLFTNWNRAGDLPS